MTRFPTNHGGSPLDSMEGIINVYFLFSDNGISPISSTLFSCRKTIFFAEFGAKFDLKCVAKNLKIG